MASSDIRRFNWFDQYIVQSGDLTNFQTWFDATIGAIAEGAHGAAVLSGLGATVAGGLNISIAPGIAVNSSGRALYLPTATQVAVPSDGSNPTASLIVLRPVSTPTTSIPQPTNPLVTVQLHNQLTYSLLVLPGTPAATPQFPAAGSDDVIVMGVVVPAGVGTVTTSHFDRSVISTRRKRTRAIRSLAGTAYTVGSADDIMEVAATGGAVTLTLPTANTVPGQSYTVVKIDSTSSSVFVAGNGGELVSGQSSIELDSQWSKTTVYSNGLAWRAI